MGNPMKTSALWAISGMFAAAAGVHGTCFAAEKGGPPAANLLGALAESAIPTAELGKQSARGTQNINVKTITANTTNFVASGSGGAGSAFDVGNLNNNSVSGISNTGMIGTTTLTGNLGFATVFENTGNNSMFQQSIAITVNVH
jgi:hypothetical protein